MMRTRREFLKSAAAAATLAGGAGAPRFSFAQEAGGKTFVKVFMRGGADGLHLFPKVSDMNYYNARGTIAIEPPNGDSESAVDLGAGLARAMNPNLAALSEIWDSGRMLVMPACGLPAGNRSHFDAQRWIGNGARSNLIDGYLNRYLQETDTGSEALRGAVLGKGSMSTELRGGMTVPVIANGTGFDIQTDDFCFGSGCADNRLTEIMNEIAATEDASFDSIASRARDAQRVTLANIDSVTQAAAGYTTDADGLEYDGSPLGRGLQLVAQLLKAEVPLEVAALDWNIGWDTHTNQTAGGSRPFTDQSFSYHSGMTAGARNFVTFFRDMGALLDNVVVLVCTEFGRTVRQSGTGTDHGDASSWFAFGGPTQGGMADDVANLSEENLNSRRYLPVINDYRDVAAEIMVRHVGMPEDLISTVFPGQVFTDNGFFTRPTG
ncbi:secreted protein [Yoonia maricola]|uniref:Secreted protein n=1 Tax=Yoonia maricola TaxID=420999 RepID=A0A2M8W2P9_9RHOB|nr:DUF1501 domain-containing protein [Yoonia maricola]PJI85196.1 secreted protein [Yoonia maricola]